MLLNFLHVGKCNEGMGPRWDLHVTELVALTWNKKQKSWIGCQNLAYNRCKSPHKGVDSKSEVFILFYGWKRGCGCEYFIMFRYFICGK